MPGNEIESSGTVERAALQLTLSDRELKFLRLALSPGAEPGEISASAIRFVEPLRSRGIEAEAFEPLLESIPEVVEPVSELVPVVMPPMSHFERAVNYVLSVPVGPSPEHQLAPEFAWLHQQFLKQSVVMRGRI